jgi:hypothetical protein
MAADNCLRAIVSVDEVNHKHIHNLNPEIFNVGIYQRKEFLFSSSIFYLDRKF